MIMIDQNTSDGLLEASAGLLQRSAVLFYGLLCYAAFFVVFVYFIAFVMDVFVPFSVDRGVVSGLLFAVAVNLALIGAFAVQHTIMARPVFKQWVVRYIPEPAERSTFVLFATLILAALCFFWQPIPAIIWQVESGLLATALWSICVAGWLLLFASSYMIDHYDLFGLRQVWLYFNQRPYTHPEFVMRGAYKSVRHPLMLGVLLGVWAIPTMTAGHLLLAIGLSVYILIGTWYEERDMVGFLGERYREYQHSVPKLLPWRLRAGKR
jgi:protein-S-isoprenylcysteine O-methyltransferase Ste14